MFRWKENIAGLSYSRFTAHIQQLYCKSFITWPAGHAVSNSVLPKHLWLMK